jgi:hypothetical protein
VSVRRLAELAERKAQLAAHAELDRAYLALAIHDVRTIVAPTASSARLASARPTASMLVGFVAPILGGHRFSRWLRIASMALAAYRIARNWRTVR